MSAEDNELTRGGRLAKNVVWNLLSIIVPFLVAIITIPILIDGIGKDRFGLLAISWMFVGYFSLFDFGLGRALTVLVAKCLGEHQHHKIPGLVWTAMILMTLLGVIGFVVIFWLTPWLVGSVLKVPSELQHETQKAFYLLSVSIPFVIVTVGLRGVIAAYQQFKLLTAIRIPMGIFTFVGPVAVLPFSTSLYPIVAVLVAGRFIAVLAHFLLMFRIVPEVRQHYRIDPSQLRPLFGFGGWMTVSNIVVPLMVSMDRFVIGAVLSVTAVAFYTTPYEIVFRLMVIPTAFVAVLLPAQSTTLAIEQGQDRKYSAELFNKGLSYIFIALFPLLLVISLFSFDGLKLWVGEEFAENGYQVMQWLAVGVLFYGLSLVPFSLVQSAGHPDWSAKLHLLELPIYLAGLWWALTHYGILGAALVWTLRAWLDALALYMMSLTLIPECRASAIRFGLSVLLAVMLFVLATQFQDLLEKFLFAGIVLTGFIYLVWRHVLEKKERLWLLRGLGVRRER
ncbi:MAG: flippase [Candidatus Thiodiazotropha endolucinida]|nr:flippase [Candidatus Thiodiazotropha taylori]MCW4265590.1 flippase [Candidatus Thiodiazotropha endolucinida]MCG8104080.1 flippase [Candidatus Thiodiazotropha taylori]MCG8119821.1 flippase [Candidatus Thiodiazotropha taylori]MCW4289410.1 flippase [Candidatus Thiodiazotropha endolucinida]